MCGEGGQYQKEGSVRGEGGQCQWIGQQQWWGVVEAVATLVGVEAATVGMRMDAAAVVPVEAAAVESVGGVSVVGADGGSNKCLRWEQLVEAVWWGQCGGGS